MMRTKVKNMIIHPSLLTTFCGLSLAAIATMFTSAVFGQQPGVTFKGVTLWTLQFKVIIKTKCEKFCTISSEETTEGHPDWVINYSIYREFGGGYYLGGPIAGEGMPKLSLPDGSGTRSGAPSPTQIKDVMQDLSKYVGWQYPGPGVATSKQSPALHAKVNDEFDLTGKAQECTKSSYEIQKTAHFDDELLVKYAFADLALNFVTDQYNTRFNILPANPGDPLNLVNVKSSQTFQSDDPSEKSNDSKNSNTTEPLSSYLLESEKSVKNPDLVFQGGMQEGTNEIKVCRQEKVKNFDYYNPYVTQDVEKNKTLVVMIALTIRKGLAPLSPSDACN